MLEDTTTLGYLVGPEPVFRERLLLLELLFEQFAKERATNRCYAVIDEIMLDELVHEKIWKGKPRGH